jgi:DNA-binding LacI/PurR family transcriptional regulator
MHAMGAAAARAVIARIEGFEGEPTLTIVDSTLIERASVARR